MEHRLPRDRGLLIMARILPRRVSRAYLLYVLPFPLFFVGIGALMSGSILRAAAAAGAITLYYGGAVTMRKGLLAEAAIGLRKYLIRPPKPLKLLGSLLVGAGSFVTSWMLGDMGIWPSLVFAGGAAGGSLLVYGMDPRPSYDASAMEKSVREETLQALASAEEKVLRIEQASSAIGNEELSRRLQEIGTQARVVLEILSSRPENVRQARKFLNTYLESTVQVADGYAKTHSQARAQGSELESSFRNVLTTIEEAFAEQQRKLVANDVMDLDVKIEVLQTQLEREGI